MPNLLKSLKKPKAIDEQSTPCGVETNIHEIDFSKRYMVVLTCHNHIPKETLRDLLSTFKTRLREWQDSNDIFLAVGIPPGYTLELKRVEDDLSEKDEAR